MATASHKRYTRFVSLSKSILWIFVAGLITLLIWVASDNNADNGARVVFSNIAKSATVLQNIMANPHYQGVDNKNRPYTVVADKATQLDKDNIALTNIRADIALEHGVWVALNAGAGTLNLATKKLVLTEGVDVFYDEGYEFRTDHVDVDIGPGSAYGDAEVEGQGPMGTLKAKGFSLTDHGKIIHFNESVRMKLYR